jgi:hypothetical protein
MKEEISFEIPELDKLHVYCMNTCIGDLIKFEGENKWYYSPIKSAILTLERMESITAKLRELNQGNTTSN